MTRTLIIAHRGASQKAPENTLAAFQLAWQDNADGIEGDFYLTKDNEIVCIHDDVTSRVSNVDLSVPNSTLAQLKQLDVGSWFDSTYQAEKIPTLSEVLAILPPEKKLFIEIKCGVEIVPRLVAIVNNTSINLEQLAVISFNAQVLQQIKQYIPSLKTLLLSTFTIDPDNSRLQPSPEEAIAMLTSIQADGFSSQAHLLLNEQYIHSIKQSGYEYHVWTVDQLEMATKLSNIGVDSLTTNVADYLIKARLS